MSSVNKVIIVGNLGRDPEMRTFPNGGAVTNVNIATTDRWKDKQSGEMKEATEWHRVAFSDRLAEVANEYLRTGSQVYVEGSLRTRKWTDKDGVERYSTEIRATNLQMLGKREDGDGGGRDDRREDRGGQQQSRGNGNRQGGQQQRGRDEGRNSYAEGRGRAQPQRQREDTRSNGRSAPADDGFSDWEDDIPF